MLANNVKKGKVILAILLVIVTKSINFTDAGDSCVGRCEDSFSPSHDCQCNSLCTSYRDCCSDYAAVCLGGTGSGSCKDKCDTRGRNSSWTCQCNKPCFHHGDCCSDYVDECGTPGMAVTDQELRQISEELFNLESTNNAASYVAVDLQAETSRGSTVDRASKPLLTVQPEAYNRPTIQLLLTLYDNYIPEVNQSEVITSQELQEQEAFVDAILDTPVFKSARQFLISKGFLNESNFRSTFEEIWFGQYSRAKGQVGSSGFEHVFLGETREGVSGFHNWIRFALEEANGDLNYHGHIDLTDLGRKGSLVRHNFEWRNSQKPISSMLVGTSPELELGLFTICWYARPNGVCPMQLNSVKIGVTTYGITYSNKKYVATSYVDPARDRPKMASHPPLIRTLEIFLVLFVIGSLALVIFRSSAANF